MAFKGYVMWDGEGVTLVLGEVDVARAKTKLYLEGSQPVL